MKRGYDQAFHQLKHDTMKHVYQNALPFAASTTSPGDGNCYFHAAWDQLKIDRVINTCHERVKALKGPIDMRHRLAEFIASDKNLNEDLNFQATKVALITGLREQHNYGEQICDDTIFGTWLKRMKSEEKVVYAEDLYIELLPVFLGKRILYTSQHGTVGFKWVHLPAMTPPSGPPNNSGS